MYENFLTAEILIISNYINQAKLLLFFTIQFLSLEV